MTTTQSIIETNARLKVYENLYIKRRWSTGYESDWLEITQDLLEASKTKVSQRLDFDNYGYGQFISGYAKFKVNNSRGLYNGSDDMYSYFSGTVTRHYTKILYKVGYYDNDGSKIDEQTFYGLLNEKSSDMDYESGIFEFSALSLNQLLSERIVLGGVLSGILTLKQILARIINDSTITAYITYDAANINPSIDIIFDDASYYENKKVTEVLNELCLKSNSIWYINADNELIVDDRTSNTNIPFLFKGGNKQDRDTNIIKIVNYDAGYTKLINKIIYDDNTTISQYQSNTENLQTYGTNILDIDGEDITDSDKKNTIANTILAEWQTPRRRIILTTVYMPNVINFFDRCIIDYKPKIKTFGKNLLIWNAGTNFNDNYHWGVYDNMLIIKPDTYWQYYGYEHDIDAGITQHYLIEGETIGEGISNFIWNLGNWNNTEFWNANA